MKKKIDSLSANKPASSTPVVEEVKAHSTDTKPVEAAAPAEPKQAETTPAPAAATEPITATPAQVPGETPAKDSFEELFPEPRVALGAPPTWLWWVLLLVISAVLGVVGYALTRHNLTDWLSTDPTPSPTVSTTPTAPPTATPDATATPTPDPTATPTPTGVDPAKVTLRVLNGTTTSGAAGKAATTLSKAGYIIRTTGNAKTQDYKSTIIYYTTGHQAEAEAVQAALTGYTATVQESTLAAPDMVLVVIGKS